jgi:DNA-binding NarL/FixJ family response regulator
MFREHWHLVKDALKKMWKPHSKMPAKRITVLLAEDHAIVREGLLGVLKAEDDIEVVGEAVNGRQAVKLAKKFLPTVVILDIAMPLLNGLEATRQILKFVPDAKVLILSAHTDDAYVEHVIALGGVGYLVKQQTFANVLVEAIREIQKGNRFLSPGISRRFIQRRKKSPDRADQSGAAP